MLRSVGSSFGGYIMTLCGIAALCTAFVTQAVASDSLIGMGLIRCLKDCDNGCKKRKAASGCSKILPGCHKKDNSKNRKRLCRRAIPEDQIPAESCVNSYCTDDTLGKDPKIECWCYKY